MWKIRDLHFDQISLTKDYYLKNNFTLLNLRSSSSFSSMKQVVLFFVFRIMSWSQGKGENSIGTKSEKWTDKCTMNRHRGG